MLEDGPVWALGAMSGTSLDGVDVAMLLTDGVSILEFGESGYRPYSEDETLDPKVWECLHISEVFERAAEFDLIHNHFDFLPLSFSGLIDTPVVTTIHGFSSPRILPGSFVLARVWLSHSVQGRRRGMLWVRVVGRSTHG